MKIFKNNVFLVFLIPFSIYCQDDSTEVLAFFPLHIGDVWQWQSGPTYIVTGDTIIDSNRYFIKGGTFFRYDSTELIVFQWDHYIGDLPYLDFRAEPGEWYGDNMIFQGDGSEYLFGQQRETKLFEYNREPLFSIEQKFALGIGQFWEHERHHGEEDSYSTLAGCIIDGVQYGAITSIDEIESIIPEKMVLKIFPNPTNNSSVVTLELTDPGSIIFTIYSIDGRSVARSEFPALQKGDNRLMLSSIIGDKTLISGIYLLESKYDGDSSIHRFAIIK